MKRRVGIWFTALILLWGCGAPDTADDAPGPRTGGVAAPEGDQPLVNPFDAEQLRILLASSGKRLCSSVFISRRSREHVLAEELQDPAEQGLSFQLTEHPAAVVASAAGESAMVLYRAHLGCTVVEPSQVDELLSQFDSAAYPAVVEPDLQAPWPDGSRVDAPQAAAGLDLDAVNRAVASAFAERDPEHPVRSRAVVVVHDGHIVAERYAEPFDATTPQLGWSMTKTVTNALTGILVKDGVLDVNAAVAVEHWQSGKDPRADITLGNLLHMSSGLAFSEVYTAASASDVIQMLYGEGVDDMGTFTARKPLTEPPGTHWSYASGTTNLISKIHRQTFDSLQAYLNFPRDRLFNKLRMSSAVMEPDVSGTFVGSSYMYATPRDWARIGLLYLQDGVWNGERILPAGWVDYSLTPAPAAVGGHYGAHIWLNRGPPESSADRPHPELPADMYYLSGFEGQSVVVVPSRQLVVVRMGLTGTGTPPIWTLTRQILNAMD